MNKKISFFPAVVTLVWGVGAPAAVVGRSSARLIPPPNAHGSPLQFREAGGSTSGAAACFRRPSPTPRLLRAVLRQCYDGCMTVARRSRASQLSLPAMPHGARVDVGCALDLIGLPTWLAGGELHQRGARGCGGRDALEGKGPQRRPQKRSRRRLEEVAEAVGGGYCRLQMPLRLAFAVRGTAAGHRLGALEGGGLPLFQCVPSGGALL